MKRSKSGRTGQKIDPYYRVLKLENILVPKHGSHVTEQDIKDLREFSLCATWLESRELFRRVMEAKGLNGSGKVNLDDLLNFDAGNPVGASDGAGPTEESKDVPMPENSESNGVPPTTGWKESKSIDNHTAKMLKFNLAELEHFACMMTLYGTDKLD